MTTEGGPAPSEPASSAQKDSTAVEVLQPHHLYKAAGLLFLLLLLYSHFGAVAHVLLLVYASAILAVALNTFVSLIPRHRRVVSAILGIVIFGAFGLALWIAVPALAGQLRSLAGDFPRMEEQLDALSEWLREQTGLNIDLYGDQTRGMITEMVGGAEALGGAWGVIEGIFLPFVIIVGALYAVAKPNQMLLSPVLHVVPRERRESFRRLFVLLGERLRGYVKGTLLAMMAVGLLATVGLWLLGVRYASLLGVIAGLLEIIPILGPWVAGGLAVAVAFVDDPSQAMWVALLMLAIQQLESNLITPIVMSQAAEVHPFITLFSLLFFGAIFGFLGLIMALPLVLLVWTVVEVLWVDRALDAGNDEIAPLVDEG